MGEAIIIIFFILILGKYIGLGHRGSLGTGLTFGCWRSAIIDSAVNEEGGVCRLQAKEQWQGQPGLAEKFAETFCAYL